MLRSGLISGAGALFGQMVWILLFYFLFNLYGRQILAFASASPRKAGCILLVTTELPSTPVWLGNDANQVGDLR